MFNYKMFGNTLEEALYQRKSDMKDLLKGRTEDELNDTEYDEWCEIDDDIHGIEYEIETRFNP